MALLLANIVVHYRWFDPHGYLTSGDAGVYPSTAQAQLGTNAVSLQTGLGLGGADLTTSYHPLQVAYALLAHLGLGYPASLKLLVLWPYLVISSSSIYYLLKQVLRSSAGILIGGSVALFNTYTLVLQGGQLLVLVGDALLVLWLGQLLRMASHGASRLRFALFVATGFVLSVYEFRIFYLAGWLVVICGLYLSVWRRSPRPGLVAGGGIVAVVALNAYWILPLGRQGSLTSNALVDRGLFGSQFFDLSSSLTVFHRFWTGSATAIFVRQPIPAYFWLIPVFALIGVVLVRQRPKAMFFAIVGVLGILLSKQAAAPFPNMYQFLYDHLPGFNVFREASKFYLLTVIAYSVFLGAVADWVSSRGVGSETRRAGAVFVCTLLACLFAVNTRPLLTGSFDTMFLPRNQPDGYAELASLLNGGEYFRTLWLPSVSRWAPYDVDHPAISLSDAVNGPWAGLPAVVAAATPPAGEQSTQVLLGQPTTQDLFDSASVRYVVVPAQDPEASDDVFNGIPRDSYTASLAAIPWLTQVRLVTTTLTVFENKTWAPSVIASNATVTRVSLDQYSVQMQHVSSEERVTLGLAYDPGWVLAPAPLVSPTCVGPEVFNAVRDHPATLTMPIRAARGDTWTSLARREHVDLGALLKTNRQRRSAAHTRLVPGRLLGRPPAPAPPMVSTTVCRDARSTPLSVGLSARGRGPGKASSTLTDGWLTSWTVSPVVIARDFSGRSSRRNPDGSYDVAFSLTYAPQATFDLGLLLSVAALLALVGILTVGPRFRGIAGELIRRAESRAST